MKKIFFFAAAAVAAMTVNAASFVGFDGRKGDLGVQIHDGNLLQNKVNVTLNETDATDHKYEIKNTEAGEMSFTMGGIQFSFSDQGAGKVAFKTSKTYIQPNGVRRFITIPTVVGEKVRIFAQDAISGLAVSGAEGISKLDLVAWGSDKDQYVELTANASKIVINSDNGEEGTTSKLVWKIGAILPAEGTGIEGVNAESVKAVKRVVDGQVVIERDGRLFNLLGAEIAR